jgi:hypothetical protein
MLDLATFKITVENAPLVSIMEKSCLVREKPPLKGLWFTPGGRFLKNEATTVRFKK